MSLSCRPEHGSAAPGLRRMRVPQEALNSSAAVESFRRLQRLSGRCDDLSGGQCLALEHPAAQLDSGGEIEIGHKVELAFRECFPSSLSEQEGI